MLASRISFGQKNIYHNTIYPGTMTLGAFSIINPPCYELNSLLCRLQAHSVFSHHALKRYASHFGPLNNKFTVANHTLVLFDAPGFVQEDYERAGDKKSFAEWKPKNGHSFEFLKKIHEGDITTHLHEEPPC
jgi:hypothetical protein